MTPAISAIPTLHAGVLFRSRLEARWATFFDHLGIRWEYEPESFRLSSGEGYIPDFWLPDLGWYAEVKPTGVIPSKAMLFSIEVGAILLCVGPPSCEPLALWGPTEYGERTHDYVTLMPGGELYWAFGAGPEGARLGNANGIAVSAALSARFGT